MTRVISGIALGIVALGLIWFLSSIALVGVALVVAALAFHEYERIVDTIGAKIPFWTTLLATLLTCAMIPFQWVDLESILAAALLMIALNVLLSDRVGTPSETGGERGWFQGQASWQSSQPKMRFPRRCWMSCGIAPRCSIVQ